MAKLSAIDKVIQGVEHEIEALQHEIEAKQKVIRELETHRPHKRTKPRVVKPTPDEKTA